MKKLCALLCVLAMVCALCVPAMAAPEGNITVHVDPFDDWTNISLYVWIDDSTNLAAWPGTAMTDADGDGWYELDIPAGYPNVIVAADGGKQTVDMQMDGNKEVWITLNAMEGGKGNAAIVYSNPGAANTYTSTDIPSSDPVDPPVSDPVIPSAPLDKLSMMGEGLPTLNWDTGNPANEMTKEGNVFVKELGVSAGTTIKFKFAGNGTWDSGYNFGSGIIEVGTPVAMANGNDSTDMTYTATETCTLKFTVDCTAVANGGAATVLLEILPPAAPPEIDGESITISVDPFDDWTQVLLYVWNDQGEYAAWPGVIMTDADGDGWFEMPIPAGYTGLIVSNGNGYQTEDLTIDGEIDMWFTIRADETGMVVIDMDPFNPGPALNETTPVPVPDPLEKLSLMGEGMDSLNWDTGNPANEMDKVGDTFIKELQVAAGTSLKIKFAGNGAWDSGFNYGGGAITIGQKMDLVSNGNDMTLTVDADCILKFTVDTTGVLEGTIPTLLVEQTLSGEVVDPTEPTTEATEPTTEATEPTTEATEPESTAPATEATQPAGNDKKDGGNTTVIIAIIAAVVIVASVVVILVSLKGKKQ